MRHLIDTSWIIEHLRGNQLAVQRLLEFRHEGLGVSAISVAELFVGVWRSRYPERSEVVLSQFLSQVETLPIDGEVSRIFSREKVKLLNQGRIIGDFDLLIGATALAHNLTLLTADRDFDRLESLPKIYL